tara:strand:+ start:251 stop:496 length:246 start_codon:yes stop_codon:yes gene_type:complete
MMSIGKTVYNVSNVDMISFGTVVSEKMEDGWKWYRVSWSDLKPSNPYNKPNYNPETGWFRCDTLRFFNPSDLIARIRAISR